MDNYDDEKYIIKKFGRGFYRSSFIFPKKIRNATWIYYSSVRLVDEIVDGQDSLSEKEKNLISIEKDWHETNENHSSRNLFLKYYNILEAYKIPKTFTEDFFTAMKSDLSVKRYDTYADLEKYMHSSAVVVGYTMSYIIGFKKIEALEYARALAEGFQLINFIRDIYDDYINRDRIYIPKEHLDIFGVNEEHIKNKIPDDKWKALMKFEITKARELCDKGISGIKFLDKNGRHAVYASALIYKELLKKIEKNNYDIFSKRITVSKFKKTMLLFKAICKIKL